MTNVNAITQKPFVNHHEVSWDSAIKGDPHATNVCRYDPARRVFGDSTKVRV
jgi:hypothetical protein